MHRYYEPGYYWYRENPDARWEVVEIHKLNGTAPVSVLFIGRARDRVGDGEPIDSIKGQLVGPIPSPDTSSRKVVPILK